MENIREIALDTLLALEKDGGLSHKIIHNVLDKYDYLDPRDKKYLKRLTEGTLERRIELDHYLDHFSSVPVRKMKPLIRNLLRMSAYQLLYMDSVPDSAVCNEACKLAEKRKFHSLKGFVNGVLRKIAREKENLPMPDPKAEPVEFLCVKYSMPELITREWISEYGPELTETMLKGLLEVHPVSLRVREGVTAEEKASIRESLLKQGISLENSECDENVFLARELDGLDDVREFEKGLLTVQDVSSVLAVKMAGIRKGDFVIDACAAPGGKSILASELAGDEGRVICGDVSDKKTMIMQENVERMGRKNVEIRTWDARMPETDLLGKADVLLLDVPCSGLGVMGKKRDVKYHASEEGYVQVEAVQAGNNKNHSIDECVGYVLTFENGTKLYVSGDTSKTDQMAELADQHIDYAFFCCDGIYNMDLDEAAECAGLVQAKHNIPYHMVDAENPDHFDLERAEQFDAPGKLILKPGEELALE